MALLSQVSSRNSSASLPPSSAPGFNLQFGFVQSLWKFLKKHFIFHLGLSWRCHWRLWKRHLVSSETRSRRSDYADLLWPVRSTSLDQWASVGMVHSVVPVYYVSRSLTDCEQRYSLTEHEALALVLACNRKHWKGFQTVTDRFCSAQRTIHAQSLVYAFKGRLREVDEASVMDERQRRDKFKLVLFAYIQYCIWQARALALAP